VKTAQLLASLLLIAALPSLAEEPVFEEVVVYATDGKLITGLQAETELDAAAIATYGANTIGDLLTQLAPEVDNTQEGPIVLVNGRPANGIRSVNDLPPEAIQNVQVLPPQAATALGYPPTRRVINVVLKQNFRSGMVNVTGRLATAGQGFNGNANGTRVNVQGSRFRNFSVFAQHTAPLYEADRHIESDPGAVPYDLLGNVVSWPLPGGEIDPVLSSQVGAPVRVLGLEPGPGSPVLAELVPRANLTNTSDMGRYRTLLPDSYTVGANANISQPLSPRTTINLNLNANRNESRGFSGATPVLLDVPVSSPFSPFSRDVGIARYLGEPLQQHARNTALNLQGNLNSQLKKVRLVLTSNFNWQSQATAVERRLDTGPLQGAISAGAVNPFIELPADLLGAKLSDHSRGRNFNGLSQLQLMGSPLELKRGKVNASLRLEWQRNEQHSTTQGVNQLVSDNTQQRAGVGGTVQVPLLGKADARDTASLGADLSGALRRVSLSGTLEEYGYGLNWRRGARLTLRAGINHEQVAPLNAQLTGPVVIFDGVRAYDFIRQETVLVRYISGGNPELGVENRRSTKIGGTYKPYEKRDLTFNLDYTRTIGHDAVATLPPVSADVQAAFPDRYLRDAGGHLVQIDARPVTFERTQVETLRWGANFKRTFGALQAPPQGGQRIVFSDGSDDPGLAGPGWRVSGNFTHTWQLSSKRLARVGLPQVDLLSGGVSGYSAQARHAVQGRVGAARNSTGLQLNANWTGASHITTGSGSSINELTFDPLLRLDVSAFASLGDLFPAPRLLKGVRLTLLIENLIDAKQRVRDENGVTPLRYQAYLLNPTGRMVGLSMRRTF
jgi:iron complex outermembrane recepter protein